MYTLFMRKRLDNEAVSKERLVLNKTVQAKTYNKTTSMTSSNINRPWCHLENRCTISKNEKF